MTDSIKFEVPVLFLIFNRPDITLRVFEEIRKIKPLKLYVAADGPRKDVSEDLKKCSQAREIINRVDWHCEIKTLLRKDNLGCKKSVSEGIDWLFTHEDKGIILEDDALPDQSFFGYCRELLEYYKHDSRIMMISGDNFQFGKKRVEYSYYFSKYTHIWGWATWRRAWNYYDVSMKLWAEIRDKGLLANILFDKREISYWSKIFDKVYRGEIDAWSYQWLFACWMQNGLNIVPEVNLISNIGFGKMSTHTKIKCNRANLKSKEIVFPLAHPPYIMRNVIADNFDDKTIFSSRPVHKKIINKICGLLNN